MDEVLWEGKECDGKEENIIWTKGGVMGRRSGRQQVEQQALPPPSHQNSGWRGEEGRGGSGGG